MNKRKKTIQHVPIARVSEKTPIVSDKFRVPPDLIHSINNKKSNKSTFSAEALFKPAEPMPGVLPNGMTGAKIAMDAGFSIQAQDINFPGYFGNASGLVAQGYAWPGFAELANLSVIAEFRKPGEVFARELTRKWINIVSTGDEDKTEKVKELEAEFKRLKVQAVFRKAMEQDAWFGRSQIFLEVGDSGMTLDGDELKTELVESSDKITKGSLKRLAVVEPIWSYPNRYNADNPLDPTFYKPLTWLIMGKEVHHSRLCTVVTREMPDIIKPAYAFSGISLTQLMIPYVNNWLRTRQSVSDLIHAFTVWVLKTDMSRITMDAQAFFDRMELFNAARDNHGVNAVDKDSEDFTNISTNLGSLDKLQAQAQEQMCSVASMPLVFLTGITPAGLNASSQDEIEVFHDTNASIQEILTPHVSKIMNIAMLSLWGEIDPEIGFEWNPMKVVTEHEKEEIRKMQTETNLAYVDAGVLSAEEVREHIANEEDSPFHGLDLSKEIEPVDTGDGSDHNEKDGDGSVSGLFKLPKIGSDS